MKYLAWSGGIFLTIFVGLYGVLFTPFGNSLLQPAIESKIQEQTKLKSKLSTFSLSMSDFSIVIELDRDNIISANGNYSLFSQAFNIAYRADLNKLESLKSLTNSSLQGILKTEGSIVGDLDLMQIDGKSDVAESETKYHVELKEFNPTSIIAKIEHAKLSSLLRLSGQKAYASATVDLDVNFKNITPHQLDGNMVLSTKDGQIDTTLMKNDFNLTLPSAAFNMEINAELTGDDIKYKYTLSSNLAHMTSSGTVVPEPLRTDIVYSIDIKELALFKPITNTPLRGPFKTDGSVIGTKESMQVVGKSDIGESDTTYNVTLEDFQPLQVIAKIKDAKLQKLLYMTGQENFASSKVDMDVKLTSLDPENLAGYVDLNLNNGHINTRVMKKSFAVNIPKTTFESQTHLDLKGIELVYTTAFNSNLAKFNSEGSVIPQTVTVDLKYALNVKELALLKPVINADIRGAFNLEGTLKGSKKNMQLKGKSDVAGSKTNFNASLVDFQPATLKASVEHLKIQKLLYMVKQPHYTDGNLYVDVDISDARSETLNGVINTRIEKGLLDSAYLTKAYEFKSKMPKTQFDMKAVTNLKGTIADTKLDFNSDLATLDVKQARFNMKDGSIVTDYLLNVVKLDKLFFVIQRHMRGGLSAKGEFKKAKDLDLTVHSNIAGGKLDAKLHNDDFHADLKSIQTLDALHILMYPEIFKATLTGSVDYNLAREKGVAKADLLNGQFTRNQMLDLVKTYGNRDLYKERFQGNLNADIKKENIVASLNLKSNKSSIKTKNTKLNSKTQKINSKVDINANGNPFSITLQGKATSPKVSIDAEKLIKKEAEKAVKKELNKLLKGLF